MGAVDKECLESVFPGFQRHWHRPGMGARSAQVTPTNITTSMQKDEKPRQSLQDKRTDTEVRHASLRTSMLWGTEAHKSTYGRTENKYEFGTTNDIPTASKGTHLSELS